MLKEKFLQYLQFEKRYSKHTVTSYNSDLNDFRVFCETSYNLSEVHEADHTIIRSWVVNLMENKLNPRSVNRKLTCLSSFFKFLMKINVLKTNPLLKVVHPKNKKRLPVFVEESKMENLFNLVEFKDDFKGQRDKLILILFYTCGIRLSELINLKINDVHKTGLKVLGKRNKERIIPVIPALSNQVQIYIGLKNKHFSDNKSEFLVLSDKGEKLNEKFVYRKVKLYLSQVTSMSKRSPHIIRHTFATHMLNNGAGLNAIKELLGHANLAATQIYTHNTVEKLKSVYQQAHPLAG